LEGSLVRQCYLEEMKPSPDEPPLRNLEDCLDEIERCIERIGAIQHQPEADIEVAYWKRRKDRADAKYQDLLKMPRGH
jgi:hypothetical protein